MQGVHLRADNTGGFNKKTWGAGSEAACYGKQNKLGGHLSHLCICCSLLIWDQVKVAVDWTGYSPHQYFTASTLADSYGVPQPDRKYNPSSKYWFHTRVSSQLYRAKGQRENPPGDPCSWDINSCNAGAVLERCGEGWFRSESWKLSTYQLVNIPTLTHNHKLWLVTEVKRSDTSKTIPCWRSSGVLLRRPIKYNVRIMYVRSVMYNTCCFASVSQRKLFMYVGWRVKSA